MRTNDEMIELSRKAFRGTSSEQRDQHKACQAVAEMYHDLIMHYAIEKYAEARGIAPAMRFVPWMNGLRVADGELEDFQLWLKQDHDQRMKNFTKNPINND